MPHFMIVFIPYNNLLNISWIIFLRNIELLTSCNVSKQCKSNETPLYAASDLGLHFVQYPSTKPSSRFTDDPLYSAR